MLHPVAAAIDAAMATMEKGRTLEAAANILRAEAAADDQHPKLSAMLRINAEALQEHPEPYRLLIANESRLNAQVAASDPSAWPQGMHVVQIIGAAEAFGRAAERIRPK
jgi:hypothetical protein